jgi:hypothetical protein
MRDATGTMEKTSTAFFLSLLKTLTHKVLKKRKGV